MTAALLRSSWPAAPAEPATSEALFRLRQRAWVEHGILCVPVAEIGSDIERQVVVNIASRLYGKRFKR